MGYFGDTPIGMDNNIVPARNVYPGSDGGTLATMGAASSPDGLQYNIDPTSGASAVNTPVAAAGGTKPLAWWLGMVIVVALILFTARKAGEASEFSNIRASTYNIFLMTFIAILGITVMKIIAVKVSKVPGLTGFSSVVLAV